MASSSDTGHEQKVMTQPNLHLIHARNYAANGYEIFPANRDKTPLTPNGMKDATSDIQQVEQWWTQHPAALIACRIPEHLVVLDIDPRHGGDTTWNELQQSYARILCHRIHHSGRNDGGAHYWFQRPPGRLSIRNLNEWAKHNNVGHNLGNGKWTSGIDILHHGHRYTILPPSPHPDTGKPYAWDERSAPGEMPPFLAELITIDEQPAPLLVPPSAHAGDSVADRYSSSTTWNAILEPHGWNVVHGDGNEDGSRWRHPNATAPYSATIKHGCLFVYTPNTPFNETEPGNPNGITRFAAYATLEHRGDMSAAAKHLAGPTTHWDGWEFNAPKPTPTTPATYTNLPDDFWNTRPTLQHIRQAAHSRTRSADAVLAATLARISTLIPPSTTLPAIVGGKASLNMLIGILATSGGGKSTSNDVAKDLVPINRTDIVADIPPGSGEGLTELFFEMINEEQADGKTRKVKRQTKTAALIYLDEGQALAEMGSRKGATLLPTLRSAWSGAVIGQSNATTETHRVLKAHTYRLSIIIGFQLEYAAALIADAAGGTPQRFVYASAIDPHLPDTPPDWPGEISIHTPPITPDGTTIDFDEQIRHEIYQRARAITKGEHVPDTLDSHADLVRMKVAAILAILEQRWHVNTEDWQLAGRIMTNSNSVRTWVIEHNRQAEQQRERSYATKLAQRELVATETQIDRALRSGATSIARAVHKSDTPLTENQLRRAASGRVRKLVSLDDMIAYCTENLWITCVDGLYVPGSSKPS
jgi:hypothetical protein